MHGPISAVLRQPAPRPPHRQHDGDAAVTHVRTPVERSAHRAPSEVRPSHVARAEQVGRAVLQTGGRPQGHRSGLRLAPRTSVGSARRPRSGWPAPAGSSGGLWRVSPWVVPLYRVSGLEQSSGAGTGGSHGAASCLCAGWAFEERGRAEAATRPRAASARDPAAFASALTTMLATPPGRGMVPSDRRLVVRWW